MSEPRGRASLLVLVLAVLLCPVADAAINTYIRLEGFGDGGATASGPSKELELLSWSHGFVQPTSPTRNSAGGGTVEQAQHQNFTFTRYLDSASNALLKYAWSGHQIGKATVTCYRSDGAADNQPVKYLTIEMQHVVVSNYSVSGGTGGDLPVENVSLDYGIVTYTYADQKQADGTSAGNASLTAHRPARPTDAPKPATATPAPTHPEHEAKPAAQKPAEKPAQPRAEVKPAEKPVVKPAQPKTEPKPAEKPAPHKPAAEKPPQPTK